MRHNVGRGHLTGGAPQPSPSPRSTPTPMRCCSSVVRLAAAQPLRLPARSRQAASTSAPHPTRARAARASTMPQVRGVAVLPPPPPPLPAAVLAHGPAHVSPRKHAALPPQEENHEFLNHDEYHARWEEQFWGKDGGLQPGGCCCLGAWRLT